MKLSIFRLMLGISLIAVSGCTPAAPATPEPAATPIAQADQATAALPAVAALPEGENPENATYLVEEKPVTLVDGQAEIPVAPGSASMLVTTMWGEPVSTTIAGEAAPFAAVILNQEPGGSGSFFYVAACVTSVTGCQGTNAILLGDRVAMQTVEIHGQEIVINFAERPEGAAMTEPPSEGKTRRFRVQNNILIESTN